MSGLFQDNPPDDMLPPPEGPGLFGDPTPLPATAPLPAAQTAAYRVLARTYRPQNFDDLIGQDAMVRILRHAFARNRVAHAFMLTGVRGVGKTTTARIIARCLNCVGSDGAGGPTAEPCGTCANCTAILADRHPDVVEMDAASRTGVEDVREIIESTRFRPMQARTKVFIIDEVHMLSRNAFNALLKTLEEPPPHVKFIFATTEIRKVPITVLSRCQRFDLRRVGINELSNFFGGIAAKEAVVVSAGALDMIARAADGSVRDGLSLLDQAIVQNSGAVIETESVAEMLGLADRSLVFDLMEAVMAGQPAVALAITERMHERGADLGVLLADLLELCHTLSRLKAVPDLRRTQELPEAERTRGAELADRLSVPVLGRTWQMLLKGVGEVEAAPDRRAAAEMVLIRLCHVADMPPPGELARQLSQVPVPERTTTGVPAPGGGGARMTAGGRTMAAAQPALRDPTLVLPSPTSFRDVVAMADSREAMLHAHLLHSVHLVRFSPPVIELRPDPAAPRDLAPRLAALLLAATGTRWTIALSTAAGEPTLAQQGSSADAGRRAMVAEHPLVRAILEAFPGATIDAVRDSTVDAYGLEPMAEPDMPEFAPADAVAAYDDSLDALAEEG